MKAKHLGVRLPFHYGWLIVFAGALGIFSCLGLGRFALGMLLPAMGEQLHLSYGQMGLISTSNFIGYLVGILFCPRLTKKYGPRNLISASLCLVGLSMVSVGSADHLWLIVFFYTLTGIGSALANIPIMGLLSAWFIRRLLGKAAGCIVIGSGASIIFSGQAIPFFNQLSGYGYRLSWVILGLIVISIAMLCYVIIRNQPQEMGLSPAGEGFTTESGIKRIKVYRRIPLRLILQCGTIYFLFGFTYVVYATFIVTTMVNQYGLSQEAAGMFWSWVGFLSLFSGPVSGWFSDRSGRKTTLAVVFAIQTLAYLLAGLNLPITFLYLSIGCFGVVAWSVPSTMAALSGDYAGPDKAVAMFSSITFIFALGQVTGPLLAGLLAQQTNSFSIGYLLAASMTALAVCLSLLLPDYRTQIQKEPNDT